MNVNLPENKILKPVSSRLLKKVNCILHFIEVPTRKPNIKSASSTGVVNFGDREYSRPIIMQNNL